MSGMEVVQTEKHDEVLSCKPAGILSGRVDGLESRVDGIIDLKMKITDAFARAEEQLDQLETRVEGSERNTSALAIADLKIIEQIDELKSRLDGLREMGRELPESLKVAVPTIRVKTTETSEEREEIEQVKARCPENFDLDAKVTEASCGWEVEAIKRSGDHPHYRFRDDGNALRATLEEYDLATYVAVAWEQLDLFKEEVATLKGRLEGFQEACLGPGGYVEALTSHRKENTSLRKENTSLRKENKGLYDLLEAERAARSKAEADSATMRAEIKEGREVYNIPDP